MGGGWGGVGATEFDVAFLTIKQPINDSVSFKPVYEMICTEKIETKFFT